MLQALSEKHNSFLRPLKKKDFQEKRVTTIELYDIGKSHDPGIQQEPSPFVPWARVMGPGFILAGMAEENPCHNAPSWSGCIAVFYLLRA